ncbi:hypothetical protein [Streptococcus sp. zg-JUN1979]|uniref:hypothetical protein n=1 Tax=Streptococcus sp. zg-JUN1979 TaxID=3391450 RepID=UPI0039AF280C
MQTAIQVFRMVQVICTIIGLIWVLIGAMDFFGGRNNNEPTRQEKGGSYMVTGGAFGVIAGSVCQAIIQLLGSIG